MKSKEKLFLGILYLGLLINSNLLASDFDLTASTAVELGFQTSSGKYYQLQRSYSVDNPVWANYGDPFLGSGRRAYGFTRSTEIDQAYFRLVEYDLSSGLVAHYPFDGNAKDFSSNQNHGAVVGATLTSDRFGNPNRAYSFNGLNQYIATTHQSYQNFGASDFSISMWVSYSSNTNYHFLIGKSDGSFNQNKWILQYGYLAGQYSLHVNTSGGASTYSGQGSWSFVSNTWHHVVVTKSGSSYKTYVNGALSGQTTGPSSIPSVSSGMTIGMVEEAGFTHGRIDDVRIFNRSLGADEVRILFKVDDIDLDKSLIAHYEFDGNADDSSAYANHAAVSGATLSADRFGRVNSAYAFNGVDQFIQAPHQDHLNLSDTEYTVAFWVKFDGSSKVMHIMGKSDGAFNNNKWIAYYSDAPSRFSMHINLTSSGSFFPAAATFTYDTSAWHHFALTKVGTTYSTFIDGRMVSQGTGPATITPTAAPLTIGSVENLSWFSGSLDDIRIYDRALSGSEVDAVYYQQE